MISGNMEPIDEKVTRLDLNYNLIKINEAMNIIERVKEKIRIGQRNDKEREGRKHEWNEATNKRKYLIQNSCFMMEYRI